MRQVSVNTSKPKGQALRERGTNERTTGREKGIASEGSREELDDRMNVRDEEQGTPIPSIIVFGSSAAEREVASREIQLLSWDI